MKILADASLPPLWDYFPSPFQLTFYQDNKEIPLLLTGHEILLCRSTLKVNENLLKNNHSLHYVATASSGSDHIDQAYLNSVKIKLLDAKGSNAPAVADYVLSSFAHLQKNSDCLIQRVGIIGMGAVGSLVAKRMQALNMTVISHDPLKKTVDESYYSYSLADILSCDLICVHANLHDNSPYPSRNLLDKSALSQLKNRAIVINAARGGIVDENALIGLERPIYYCTDVYLNEPDINQRVVEKALLCTPHIAGHSIEAKIMAVKLLSEKLHYAYGLEQPKYPTGLAQAELCETFPETGVTSQFGRDDESRDPQDASWQDYVLSMYNPYQETLALKQAIDKKNAFLALRKAHSNRHDFNEIRLAAYRK